jgi:glyoxylase-like metal-dependent hydrolase (beta-lactamase superfamily II)
VAERERASLIEAIEDGAPGHNLAVCAVLEPLAGAEIDWNGPRAVVYPHDAHAPGHGALFLPGTGVLMAGDMCSDIEIPLPDLGAADPFGGYRAGLAVLAGVPGVRAVVPGHGQVGDADEFRRRVAADRRYLEAVAAGDDYPDERLTQDWLRAEHARALARARAS